MCTSRSVSILPVRHLLIYVAADSPLHSARDCTWCQPAKKKPSNFAPPGFRVVGGGARLAAPGRPEGARNRANRHGHSMGRSQIFFFFAGRKLFCRGKDGSFPRGVCTQRRRCAGLKRALQRARRRCAGLQRARGKERHAGAAKRFFFNLNVFVKA